MALEETSHECAADLVRPRAHTAPSTQPKNLPDEAAEPLRVLAFDTQSTCARLFSKQLAQHLQLGQISHPYVLAATLGPERIHQKLGNEQTKELWRGRAEGASPRVKRTTYEAATNDLLIKADKLEKEGKTVFVTEYPPFIMNHEILSSALQSHETIISRLSNPTVIPDEILRLFTPLIFIQHPALVLPAWLRLAQDEYGSHALLDDADFTLWTSLRWSRMLFDYLRSTQHLKPRPNSSHAPQYHRRTTSTGTTPTTSTLNGNASSGTSGTKWEPAYVATRPYIIDAADVASNTHAMLAATCRLLNLDTTAVSATWLQYFSRAATTTLHRALPARVTQAWSARALGTQRPSVDLERETNSWRAEFGDETAALLRKKVDEEMPHYRYLLSFKVRVQPSLTTGQLVQNLTGMPYRRASATTTTPTREEMEDGAEGHPLRIIRSAIDVDPNRRKSDYR